MISQVLPGINPLPTAFECKHTVCSVECDEVLLVFVDEDEDCDRITVCTDQELVAMLSYVSFLMFPLLLLPPLINPSSSSPPPSPR